MNRRLDSIMRSDLRKLFTLDIKLIFQEMKEPLLLFLIFTMLFY